MPLLWKALVWIPFFACTATAVICPILGPVFTPPKHPSTSPALTSALAGLRASLDERFETPVVDGPDPFNGADSYAIQIFSAVENTTLFEYYRTGPNFTNTVGVKKIDGDSVFRIGSTGKMLAVYVLLIEAGGTTVFGHLVSKYLPELEDSIWNEVTVGSLADHTSGLPGERTSREPDLSPPFRARFPAVTNAELQSSTQPATQVATSVPSSQTFSRPSPTPKSRLASSASRNAHEKNSSRSSNTTTRCTHRTRRPSTATRPSRSSAS